MNAEPPGPDPARSNAQNARAAAMMVIDQAFDANTLSLVRAVVQAHAMAAGMPEYRAGDVMLAVHELAGNAVLHGAGAGQLHLWRTPGQLWCQVEDDGSASQDHAAKASDAGGVPTPWPYQAGHGLWLAQLVADQVNAVSGLAGTKVTAMFTLSYPNDNAR